MVAAANFDAERKRLDIEIDRTSRSAAVLRVPIAARATAWCTAR
jgi:hypothetical protein